MKYMLRTMLKRCILICFFFFLFLKMITISAIHRSIGYRRITFFFFVILDFVFEVKFEKSDKKEVCVKYYVSLKSKGNMRKTYRWLYIYSRNIYMLWFIKTEGENLTQKLAPNLCNIKKKGFLRGEYILRSTSKSDDVIVAWSLR